VNLDEIQRRIMSAPGVTVRRNERQFNANGPADQPLRRSLRSHARQRTRPAPKPGSARARIVAYLMGRPEPIESGAIAAGTQLPQKKITSTLVDMVGNGEVERSGDCRSYGYRLVQR
jgi:hypothetical protein